MAGALRCMSLLRSFDGHNPYYNPEACGLKIIRIDERDVSYSFDIVMLWEDLKTGKWYWAHDAGCSCPSPFEDFLGLGDLNEYLLTFDGYIEKVFEVSGRTHLK